MLRCDAVPYFLFPGDKDAKLAWWEKECGFSELTPWWTESEYGDFSMAADEYIHLGNSISSIIYFNDEAFATESYNDQSIKKTAKITELKNGRSKCPEVEF